VPSAKCQVKWYTFTVIPACLEPESRGEKGNDDNAAINLIQGSVQRTVNCSSIDWIPAKGTPE